MRFVIFRLDLQEVCQMLSMKRKPRRKATRSSRDCGTAEILDSENSRCRLGVRIFKIVTPWAVNT
jgi:hypothetical protein